MQLFKTTGKIIEYDYGLFFEPSWAAVYVGQGVMPDKFDVRATGMQASELHTAMASLHQHLVKAVDKMPSQMEFLAGYEQYALHKTHGAHMSLYGANRRVRKI
jgi:tryptophan halogenase